LPNFAIIDTHAHLYDPRRPRPYIAHAIDCFGFERVMFGSDWPVSELATSYRRWVDLVDRVVTGASDCERRRLNHDNAIAFYRL
jgi:L-fuconolactonase